MNNDDAIREIIKAEGPSWMIKKADRKHAEALEDLIKSYTNKEQKILDICCGYGRLAVPLVKEGYKVSGVDISENLIQFLNGFCAPNVFTVGNMKDLPFEDSSFDFCFCVWASFNFLVTIQDQLRALEEMCRVLKPGGKALIECPFHDYEVPGAHISQVQVGNLSYEYYPITVEHLRQLAKQLFRRSWNWSSPEVLAFDECAVTEMELAGRKRIVGVFTK